MLVHASQMACDLSVALEHIFVHWPVMLGLFAVGRTAAWQVATSCAGNILKHACAFSQAANIIPELPQSNVKSAKDGKAT